MSNWAIAGLQIAQAAARIHRARVLRPRRHLPRTTLQVRRARSIGPIFPYYFSDVPLRNWQAARLSITAGSAL